MKKLKGLKAAHAERVNSFYISFEAMVIISISDNALKIWDTINGLELYHESGKSPGDPFVLDLSSIRHTGELSLA